VFHKNFQWKVIQHSLKPGLMTIIREFSTHRSSRAWANINLICDILASFFLNDSFSACNSIKLGDGSPEDSLQHRKTNEYLNLEQRKNKIQLLWFSLAKLHHPHALSKWKDGY
jgi:hypothetical protein